uniref:Egg protein CP391S-like protein n=2 Tax=Schistosoma mansoni TaxID=6183 RepID=A0A913KVK8_SCHMA
MRYILPSSFLISTCLLVILLTKFFNCQFTCEHIKDVKYDKLIFENTSYRYSDHYEYFQTIRLDQDTPVVSGDLSKKQSFVQKVTPKFQFKYYGQKVKELSILNSGVIEIYGDDLIGQIHIFQKITFEENFNTANENEFIAVAWHVNERRYSEGGSVLYLIYPNGKMFIYIEKILKEFDENNLQSWIDYRYKCLDKQANTVFEPYNRIHVPINFIKSRTFVEFEPNTESCFMKVSKETCLNASKPDMECHWCSTANLCSNGRDTRSKAWMINNCSKNNMQNMQKDKKSDHKDKKSEHMDNKSEQMDNKSDQKDNKPMFNYLYVLIPSVIGLVVVGVGFIVWFWLSKRQ